MPAALSRRTRPNQFALLRVAGLFDDRRFQRRVMVLRVVLLQDVLHVVRDLVDLEREEQRLGLEMPACRMNNTRLARL